MSRRLLAPLLFPTLTLPLLLTACPQPDPTPQACTVQAVTVSPATATIKGGLQGQFTATPSIGPSGCTGTPNTTVTWTSSDTSRASVNSSGLVNATQGGVTTITATIAGKSASSTVTVSGPICIQSLSSGISAASLPAAQVVQVNTPAPDWTAAHVAGQVLVVQQNGALTTQGLGLLSTVKTQAVTKGVILAYTPTGEDDQAFARRLEAAGLQVQPNFIYKALASPNDPGFPGNAGINLTVNKVTYAAHQTYLTRIKAPEAWTFLNGCGKAPEAAATVVIDSGMEATHPELAGRALTIQSYVSSHTYDHGTATTGLIAANTNNGLGVAGVTWSGSVMHIEVIDGNGDATTSAIAQGVDYAASQGAKVINLSLGGPLNSSNDPGDTVLNNSLKNAAATAVLVAAAGNAGDFNGDGKIDVYESSVFYPASNPNVLAVGALGASDSALACYSARPSAVLPRALDLVAPGGAGYGACAGATPDQDMLLLAPGNTYALEAGTSFAAPLVSGVVALMRAANPNLSAGQTKTLLLNSVNTASGLPMLDANAAVRAATKLNW